MTEIVRWLRVQASQLGWVELTLWTAALVVTATLLVIALVSPHTWAALGREDGWVEVGNAVALGLLALVAAHCAWRLGPGRRLPSVALALFGIVGVGEEISWGQRLFDRPPSAFFETYNVQQETNLHNLIPPPWDVVIAGLIVFSFCFSPRWKDRSWALALRRRGVPWPRTRHSLALAGVLAAILAVGLLTGVGDLEELGELNIVLFCAAAVAATAAEAAGRPTT